MKSPSRVAAIALVLPLALAGCWAQSDEEGSPAPTASAADSPNASATAPASGETFTHNGVTVTGASGAEPTITLAEDFGPAEELDVADVVEGTGDPVQAGDTLTVQYVGMGEQSRTVFDSSWQNGSPATFALDGVIEGWQEGIPGMKPGGRRLLIIPGSMAYGPQGRPPIIGEDETLVFVVDLLSVEPAGAETENE